MPPITPTHVFYMFTTSQYFDVECNSLESQVIEADICDPELGTVEKCCDFVSYVKNVTLDICEGYVEYTCGDGRQEYIKEHLEPWKVVGLVFMCFLLGGFFYGFTLVLCKTCEKKKRRPPEYTPLVIVN